MNKSQLKLFIGITLGIALSFFANNILFNIAEVISNIFISLLKLIGLPLIFFSITSTLSKMGGAKNIGTFVGRIFKYTIFTTLIAAIVGLVLFIAIDPVKSFDPMVIDQIKNLGDKALPVVNTSSNSLFDHLLKSVPDNFIKPFVESNVIGILIIGLLVGLGATYLPNERRKSVSTFFENAFLLVMEIVKIIIYFLPIGVFGFIMMAMKDVQTGKFELKSILLYLIVVVVANLAQGIIVLPLILKLKGISPLRLFKVMLPSLTLAFFSKSSGASIPLSIKISSETYGMKKEVSNFVFPLCGTINMNACAAFILVTVLFVAKINGIYFSTFDYIVWIFLATLGAMGNAAVPMGCYFVACSFLAAQNIPLHMMAVILPFYTVLDMLESGLNVWSDSTIAALVDLDLKKSGQTAES